jgi:hypothetical protein
MVSNIHIVKKDIEALSEASREVDLEVNTENYVYDYASPPECRKK